MSKKLLILEDDHTMRQTLGNVFRKKGIDVVEACSVDDGLSALEKFTVHVALVDMKLPDSSGLEFWSKAREVDDNLLCIFMTAFPEIKTAVTAMREGAFDYINKPFELDELRIIVDKAFTHHQLKSEVMSLRYERDHSKSSGLIGESDAIKQVNEQIYQVAQASTTPVLILGESGTGKEIVANAIHSLSERRDLPLLKLNCSAIPETLIESELFGHEKGSFTDAKSMKKGVFELADSGTIFLDEIGDLKRSLQPKLLRVLESKTLRRVGGVKDISIDVRVISATNQNLALLVGKDSFRADLMYRLNVFTINMPPLRDRKNDISILAYHLLRLSSHALKKEITGIEKEALDKMERYSWPGNVRELKNVIERACILAGGNTIRTKDCWLDQDVSGVVRMQNNPVFSIFGDWLPLEEMELLYIRNALDHCSGNKSETARQLGISRVTLREKLRKIGIHAEDIG